MSMAREKNYPKPNDTAKPLWINHEGPFLLVHCTCILTELNMNNHKKDIIIMSICQGILYFLVQVARIITPGKPEGGEVVRRRGPHRGVWGYSPNHIYHVYNSLFILIAMYSVEYDDNNQICQAVNRPGEQEYRRYCPRPQTPGIMDGVHCQEEPTALFQLQALQHAGYCQGYPSHGCLVHPGQGSSPCTTEGRMDDVYKYKLAWPISDCPRSGIILITHPGKINEDLGHDKCSSEPQRDILTRLYDIKAP
jgi:hypothetical protein